MTFKNFAAIFTSVGTYQLKDVAGRPIAIDALVEIFRTSGVQYISGLTNKLGQPTQHIKAILANVLKAIDLGIDETWVFDGGGNVDKADEEKRRKKIREKATINLAAKAKEIDELKSAVEGLSMEEIKEVDPGFEQSIADKEEELRILKVKNPNGSAVHQYIVDTYFILECLGVKHFRTPKGVEAEQLAVAMPADGMRTVDPDHLLFGGRAIYKKISKQSGKYAVYTLEACLAEYKLTMKQFIQVAVALGTDFAPKVPRVGPKTVLKKVLAGTIEWTAEQNAAVDMFLASPAKMAGIKYEVKKPKRTVESIAKLRAWLVDVQNFGAARLDKQLAKLPEMVDAAAKK